MGRARLRVFALTLAVLGVACGRKTGPAPRTAEEKPELYLERLTIQSYGTTGLEWQMSAPVGKMFTQKNLMRVSGMTADLYENGRRSTQVTANEAFMKTAESERAGMETPEPLVGATLASGDMYLRGNVVVVSTEGNTLMTDWLHYRKTQELIVSTAPVRILRPDSETRGIGMEASSDLSNIKIFQQTLVIRSYGAEGQP